jgi:hypothetical protein
MYHRSANKISGAFSSAVSSVEHQVLSVRLLLASIAGRHHNIRSFRLQLIFLISLAANNMERYEDDPSSVADLGEAAFLDSQYVREQTKEADAQAYILQYFLFNIFLFTISALSIVCTVFTQKSPATHSTAALMEEFDPFCMSLSSIQSS